ncbi:MAG: PAS domain S-box protein [Deltaproteobacteria bacterium]|nr:PAS domain S-box protein [Deltaproteobacteria bacterium]
MMTEKKKASLRTLFLLAMSLLIIILSLPQFLSGRSLLHTIISQLGTELLTEKLGALVQPIDRRYETLRRVGLEDSATHLDEIKKTALDTLSAFRYKQTGSVFVISHERAILLSREFTQAGESGFSPFFADLTKAGEGIVDYQANGGRRLAAFRFYQPWQSYIGLTISRDELFAAQDKFLQVSICVLAVAVFIAFLFMLGMQHMIIAPVLTLTRFAGKVIQGDFQPADQGRFVLELATLKEDITKMVDTLRQQMQEKSDQLAIIRERERERDKALTQLQESEQRYRAIYNAPSEAIFIHDAATGAMLDVNQSMLEMFGFPLDEVLRLNIGDLSEGSPPYSQQEAVEKVKMAITQGPQLFAWHCRRKNGALFWGEVALKHTRFGGSHYVIAVVRDITERKTAEQALAAEKERLAVTLRSIGDGVITTDTSGRVLLLNKVAEELTGWRQEEAAGLPLPEVFHIINAKTGEKCENPADKVLSSGNIIALANHTVLIARNGAQHHIADSGAPIRDPESRIIGTVLVFRDVTEKLRYEQEMLKVIKLESVGVLAGGIAHDFNNILTAILGNINLAGLHASQGKDATALLNDAEKACLRARNLTQQLLTFAKGGSPVRQVSSITSIIRESASFVLRGSNVSCRFDIPEDLWLVNIDQGQISQVIQNIVINAQQAMPRGGTVTITCRNRTMASVDQADGFADFIEISIHDTGIGIPEKYVDKIFDPYFSSKQEGSGLGLAICHSVIHNHDGHIQVRSKTGEGTSFTIMLPATKQPVKPEQPQEELALPARKARILVMDDEEIVRTVVTGMLQHLGYDVMLAENGEEAIEIYTAAYGSAQPIDAMIVDLTVPGAMGGLEAFRRIQQINGHVKAIVSSGYSNDAVLANYRDHGFRAALCKPFRIEDIMRALQQTLS